MAAQLSFAWKNRLHRRFPTLLTRGGSGSTNGVFADMAECPCFVRQELQSIEMSIDADERLRRIEGRGYFGRTRQVSLAARGFAK